MNPGGHSSNAEWGFPLGRRAVSESPVEGSRYEVRQPGELASGRLTDGTGWPHLGRPPAGWAQRGDYPQAPGPRPRRASDGAAGMTVPEPNYPPLSTREIGTLPEGARVIVTWSEGNDGPHEYRVHWSRGEPYAQTDEEHDAGRVDLEKWLTYYVGPRRPFTRVWALAAPGAGGDFGARRLSVRDGVTAVTADDPFPYSELRNASHEFFAKVWRAQKSGS